MKYWWYVGSGCVEIA